MAPIRRYLRISKFSVLECRIYPEDPADLRWLLDTRDPVLPRVFESIRPLVLPKLREENERARAKKKSKPVKDSLVEDEFAVSIFLRETGARHSILQRHKTFENRPLITSNSSKLTGTENAPLDVDNAQPTVLEEDNNDTAINLQDIPETLPDDSDDGTSRPSKRKRAETQASSDAEPQDEKKLGFTTTYEGFSIWGWVLCLLITRRDKSKRKPDADSNQALMEEWICTQVPQEYDES